MLKKIWSGLSDDEMKTFELANKKLLSNLMLIDVKTY